VTLPYLVRLLFLCLAAFYVVNAAVSALVWMLTPLAIRSARQLRAGTAAQLLLWLRLLPAAVAGLASAGVCLPSFLWLEAEQGGERVGVAFLAAAVLGASAWVESLWRSGRAIHRSRCSLTQLRRSAAVARLRGAQAWLVESERPLLIIGGLFRPQLAVSRNVLDALSPEQLDTALSHEAAHAWSRDNLKRLLISLAPAAAPFSSHSGRLERAWSRYAEWAADDRAVNGDARRGVALAEALLAVARLGTPAVADLLCASLLPDSDELAIRVERLLRDSDQAPGGRHRIGAVGAAACVAIAALVMRPGALAAVHGVIERLVH
jgi:Zn-dependent protease with chaperone function